MRHSQATDAEERLLTELIVAAGIDATLVGSLDGVQPDSTDYLCLSSFGNQTLAVVSSLSFEQVAQQWARLQLGGEVVRMGQASQTRQPRVVYFPLSLDTATTLAELRQLLVDQSVKTVGLIMPLGKTARDSPRSQPLASTPTQTIVAKPGDSYAASPRAASLPLPSQVPPPNDAQAEIDQQWPSLDRLVDELDALDL